MQKLVWRVKLVADSGDGSATEIEVGRIEREACVRWQLIRVFFNLGANCGKRENQTA